MSRILVLSVAFMIVIASMGFVATPSDAFCFNILPPWGIGIAILDCVGCCDVIGIANLFGCCSLFTWGNAINACNFFNIHFLIPYMAYLHCCTCCSFANYGIECAWNVVGYPVMPCNPLFACCNVINFFGGRILFCNLINVMAGWCGGCNLINILSNSFVNVCGGLNVITALFPPFLNIGGFVNLGTGINVCNLCFPVLFAPFLNLDNLCMNPCFCLCLPLLLLLSPVICGCYVLLIPCIAALACLCSPILLGLAFSLMIPTLGCVVPFPPLIALLRRFLSSLSKARPDA